MIIILLKIMFFVDNAICPYIYRKGAMINERLGIGITENINWV